MRLTRGGRSPIVFEINLFAVAADRSSRCWAAALGLNANHLPRLNALNRRQRRWHERKQIFERVARRAKYDDPHLPLSKVLLKFEVLVPCHQNPEAGGLGRAEERAVFQTRP